MENLLNERQKERDAAQRQINLLQRKLEAQSQSSEISEDIDDNMLGVQHQEPSTDKNKPKDSEKIENPGEIGGEYRSTKVGISGIIKKWEHLKGQLADEDYHKSGKIHVLLGAGIWIRIIEPEIIRSSDQMTIAHKSKLGYIILGNEIDPYQIQRPYIGAVLKGVTLRKLTEII